MASPPPPLWMAPVGALLLLLLLPPPPPPKPPLLCWPPIPGSSFAHGPPQVTVRASSGHTPAVAELTATAVANAAAAVASRLLLDGKRAAGRAVGAKGVRSTASSSPCQPPSDERLSSAPQEAA